MCTLDSATFWYGVQNYPNVQNPNDFHQCLAAFYNAGVQSGVFQLPANTNEQTIWVLILFVHFAVLLAFLIALGAIFASF
jgi:hypothetical protein